MCRPESGTGQSRARVVRSGGSRCGRQGVITPGVITLSLPLSSNGPVKLTCIAFSNYRSLRLHLIPVAV